MKANFFSFLIYMLVIMLIVPGIICGIASAVYQEPVDSRSSDSGSSDSGDSFLDSVLDAADPVTGDSISDNENADTGSDTGGTDTGSDTGGTDSGSDSGNSDSGSDSGNTDSGSDNGNSDSGSDNGDSDSGSDNGDSDSGSDNGDSDSGSDNGDSDSGSDNGDSDSDSDNGDSDSGSDNGNSDSGSDNGNSDSGLDNGNSNSSDIGNSNTGNSDIVTSNSGNSDTKNSGNVSSGTQSSDGGSSNIQNGSYNSSSNSSYSSSSSSSDWGMNLISSEPASNVAVKELSTRSVMGGYPVRFDFVENATCITQITFEPKNTFRRTTTVVEELKNKSALVPTHPSGTVYKHVNVWVGDKGAGLPTSIRNGIIEFKVEKSWIKSENISDLMIVLQRYDEDWQPLYTEKVREDENYVYFEAETPGYSFFAITGYSGQNVSKEERMAALNGITEKGNSRIKNPMGAARILMAISLPLFMILAGYCVLKKKI